MEEVIPLRILALHRYFYGSFDLGFPSYAFVFISLEILELHSWSVTYIEDLLYPNPTNYLGFLGLFGWSYFGYMELMDSVLHILGLDLFGASNFSVL